MKALLIEDNPADADLISEYLSESVDSMYNIDLTCVDNLLGGLDLLNESNFDLLLLDLNLGDTEHTGLATLDLVIKSGINIPIVIMTGDINTELWVDAIRMGAQDYLIKGKIDSDTLVKTIGYALERHKLVNKLENKITELERSESRFRTLIEMNSDGLLVLSMDKKILLINQAAQEILGMEEQDLIGKEFDYSFEEFSEIKIKNDKIGKHFDKKSGKIVYAETNCSVIPYMDHDAYLVSIRNITNHKDLELKLAKQSEQLEASNKELESFAYIASHDLQEPLRKVITFGDRLIDSLGVRINERENEYILRMQKSTTRMQKLLDDLLEFSRVSHNKYNWREMDSSKVFMDVIRDLEERIIVSKASISFSFIKAEKIESEFDRNYKLETKTIDVASAGKTIDDLESVAAYIFPRMQLDETQARRIFQNLISNAIKYRELDKAPLIKIEVSSASANRWQFKIEDNGIGFEEEYKERIFRQFERLHGKSEYEGTGMGLATVKKVVERHDGEILVSSNPGKGSQFNVILPELQILEDDEDQKIPTAESVA